jgi:hypothetical protein
MPKGTLKAPREEPEQYGWWRNKVKEVRIESKNIVGEFVQHSEFHEQERQTGEEGQFSKRVGLNRREPAGGGKR